MQEQLHEEPMNGCVEERGFILISVLGALTLLALMAAVLMNTTRTNIKAQANLLRHAEAKALADGVARLVALKLTYSRPAAQRGSDQGGNFNRDGQLNANGTPLTCRIDSTVVEIAVTDVAGLVDLNGAPVALLRRLLTGSGVAGEEAANLARAIVDFRTAGANPSLGEKYKTAGLPHGPKRGPFQSVGELDQVIGINQAQFKLLRPLVTVHSKMAGIDPRIASAAVINALTGSGNAGTRGAQAASGRAGGQIPLQYRVRSLSRAFLIRVGVFQRGGTRFVREAVWLRASNNAFGFSFRTWEITRIIGRQRILDAIIPRNCFESILPAK